MTKTTNIWFRCEYPGCSVESDTYYKVQYKGKKIKVCEGCLKKIRGKK